MLVTSATSSTQASQSSSSPRKHRMTLRSSTSPESAQPLSKRVVVDKSAEYRACIILYSAIQEQIKCPEPEGKSDRAKAAWIQRWMKNNPNELLRINEIILCVQGLNVFPKEIVLLTELETLDLGQNNIQIIPSDIKELTKLKNLCISYNQLNKLPPEIGNLTELISLTICVNHLTELPPEIGKLTKLKYLNVMQNKLTKLPQEIMKLEKLERIALEKNSFSAQELYDTGFYSFLVESKIEVVAADLVRELKKIKESVLL